MRLLKDLRLRVNGLPFNIRATHRIKIPSPVLAIKGDRGIDGKAVKLMAIT